jgi:uncharacterized glyoxalase superfamily protein PhnB
MHADVKEPGRALVPTLRYRDVSAAIEWLCNAFGFERHLVVPGESGAVRYAELTFGDGMIMLGPVAESAFDKLMMQPEDVGGIETQICYLFVADAVAHCARARAAGAQIVLDIEAEDGGGRGYSCRDPEGHIWNFGTYNPWKRQQPAQAPGPAAKAEHVARRPRRTGAFVASLIATAAMSAFVVAWVMGGTDASLYLPETMGWTSDGGDADKAVRDLREQLSRERAAKEAAERAARTAGEQLARERQAKETAEQSTKNVQVQLGQERAAKEQAERVAQGAQSQITQERSARETAERAANEARQQLSGMATEQAVAELRQELAREKSGRAEAERGLAELRERLSQAEQATAAKLAAVAAENARLEAEKAAEEKLEKEQEAAEAAERAKKLAREKEAKARAAEEARDRQRARRAAPRAQPSEPSSAIGPYTIWPKS